MSAYANPPQDTVFSAEMLLEELGNDERALLRTIAVVRDRIGSGADPLHAAGDAVQQARLVEARRLIQQLRHDYAVFGAQRLAAACMRLELALTASQVLEIPALFSRVDGELQQVLEEAGTWLDQHAGRATRR